ncbi:MAG: hypothetical protein ACRC6K_03730 [Fusobacteriaceae bacterium]
MENEYERTEEFWNKFEEYRERFNECVPMFLVNGFTTDELIRKMDLCLLNDVTIEHYLPEIPEGRVY